MILPLCRPPIENGAISLSGNKIREVGSWTALKSDSADVTDLGHALLMPGLINAHCHLDYTNLAGKIPPPASFTDWIKAILPLKAAWGYSDFAQSWLHGATMLLHTGTTTVADIEAVPELLPDLWSATPLRVHSFRELINLKNGPQSETAVTHAVQANRQLKHPRNRVGLSPHAPYSTTKHLLRAATQASQQFRWQLTTHVSESEPEFEMFVHRRGAMFDWLKSQRAMDDCGLGSPIQHLDQCGYLQPNLLAVHANYLGPDDAQTLARRKVSVVHCPTSHAYFRHALFPYQDLTSAQVNICLGTDSLASLRTQPQLSPELNMFTEMQTLAHNYPSLDPTTILTMATVNAAHALGYGNHLGQLRPHALADLITIPFAGSPRLAAESALHHTGPISASFIDGIPAYTR